MTCSAPIYAFNPASGPASFPANPIIWEIGSAFLFGALAEVTTHPKPGLVTPLSNGSHSDMDLLTFMKTSAAIAPCFYECAQLGREHMDQLPSLLPKIRQVGRIYEELLLKSSDGVNTQRGYLFSAGVLCAAAGYASRLMRTFSEEVLLSLSAKVCQGLCEQELEQTRQTDPQTAGERLYQKYRVRGIRGEVEDGFPSVAKFSLPAYREALASGASEDIARIHALITLMSVLEDTTILSRGETSALNYVQQRAMYALSLGGALTAEGMQDIHKLDAELIQKNLSPGGSADLLAVTIAIEKLTKSPSAGWSANLKENKTNQTSNKLKVIKS